VRYINKVLVDAISSGASDMHFEPYEKTFRIRFRRTASCTRSPRPPVNISPRLVARLKVMSQHGYLRAACSPGRAHQDQAVAPAPSIFASTPTDPLRGEGGAAYPGPGSAQLGMEQLGFDDPTRRMPSSPPCKPYGMILVTGPTGSGKTVSLYTGLNILNSPSATSPRRRTRWKSR
jgi:type IV pilus assembly protein PilB